MSKKKHKFEVFSNEDTERQISLARKKKFSPHDLISLRPKNTRQKDFFDAYNNNVPLILLDGYPGVGKTLISLYAALHQVLDDSTHYEKVVIVRSPVESGAAVGFLPGELEDKMAVYEVGIRGLVADIIKYNDSYHNLKSLGKVEFMLSTFARGLNIKNSVVIIEEAQNFDYSELKTIISRAAEGTRIVITGDEKQDDLKRKRKVSGLSKLKKVMNNMPYEMTKTITFLCEDIERSGLVKEFIISDFEIEDDD